MGLIFWMFYSRGNHSGIVVLGKLLIAAVQNGFIARVLCYTGLQIIRYQKPCYSAEIFIGVNMAGKPVLCLHVRASLCVCKA